MRADGAKKIIVIGSGKRFISGISYYTVCLANALASNYQIAVILMRQLLPTWLYPGRKRVGAQISDLSFSESIDVFDGVDWYLIPSIIKCGYFLFQQKPDFLIFQWWTGTVLHIYILLAIFGRILGGKVIIEFHEVQDVGELKIPLARIYVNLLSPLFIKLATHYVVHSEYDIPFLNERYDLQKNQIAVIQHGPYDFMKSIGTPTKRREAPTNCINLFFFGIIRPFKGLEDLIMAFNSIPEHEISRYWLTVVGETWENWDLPSELISTSRYKERITFVNRYVSDEEAATYFNGADIVVLPYHRSSSSGPLHIAMGLGLPVITTNVGGLTEAIADYEGAVLVPSKDPSELRKAIYQASDLQGKRFHSRGTWEDTVRFYSNIIKHDQSQKTSEIR
jgi:glycosyltransferase involved in cell wall biosynthesis